MSRCHIFCFIDAMGTEVVRDQPAILDLAENVRSLRSVFGYSSACVPSILSGRYPEEHDHWSYFTYCGPGTGLRVPRWLRLVPSALRDRGRVRHRLSPAVAKVNGISGYFRLYMMPIEHLHHYSHCEPRDIFRPGGMNSGENIFDLLHRVNRDHWWASDWHQSPSTNWARMEAAAARRDVQFLFMYDGSLDAWLHENTRESPHLPQRLRETRQHIEAVLERARNAHDEVLFYVFSDHGMSTIRRTLDPFPALERSGLMMHRDYHCVIDSTMIRLWYPNESVRAAVRGALEGLRGLDLLSRDYLAAERCAFSDNRFGDDIYLAEPHLLLVPSHLGKKPLAGMHGYRCDDEDSYASFLSNDATASPECIVDLFGLMARAVAELNPSSENSGRAAHS